MELTDKLYMIFVTVFAPAAIVPVSGRYIPVRGMWQ